MRITGGDFRGLRLAELGKGDPARHLRPTADRVRESLFNVLVNGGFGDVCDGAVVLDLFAGTGALGLEALSRGAVSAIFVDDGAMANGLLKANIARSRTADRTTLIRRNATRPGPAPGEPATLVFLDPPYGKGLGEMALSAARAGGWIAPGALIVWEENAPMQPPPGFDPLQVRRYGDTHVTFLEAAEG